MKSARRKKKLIRNVMCVTYCVLLLLLVLLFFRGMDYFVNKPLSDTEAMTNNEVKPQETEEASDDKVGEIETETEMETENQVEEGPRFVVGLDAGHGGKDNGSNYRKRYEKDDNLQLVKAVAAYLEGKEVGVVLTREDDTFLSLQERCNIVNKEEVDYFVSLHRNSGDGYGVEIWIHSQADEETTSLGQNIMNGLESAGIQRNRGVRNGCMQGANENYLVNRNSTMPSCIIELGFINDEKDNELLDKKLEAYAAAIGEGIIKTYEVYGEAVDGEADETTEENDGKEPDSSAPIISDALSLPIASVETLSTEIKEWGQGTNVDGKNRPTGAVSYQDKYGQYHALFVGEEEQKIYLTFDMGYDYGYTDSILDTLKEKNVKAVFFVTKPYAKDEPELVKRMIAEGHIVGNHSATHPAAGIPSLKIEGQQKEIMDTHDYVKVNFNYEMNLFRYPAGKFSEQSLAVLANCGYTSVFWSFAYLDYDVNNQPDQAKSLQKMIDCLHPGAVYLLHGQSETNAAVLGDFIDAARARGYELALIQ